MTSPNHPPIVIPCAAEVAQGFASESGKANPTPVRVISPAVIALLLATKTPKLQKEYGPIDPEEEKRLRGFVHLADAIRREDPRKLDDVARSMAHLRWPNLALERRQLYEKIVGESLDAAASFQAPIHFLRIQVSHRARSAQLVLWLEREKKWPSPGLLCSNILEALFTLVLFSIGSEQVVSRKTAHCICGAVLVRATKGGDRRKTCSEKCRKRWTRAQQKQKQT